MKKFLFILVCAILATLCFSCAPKDSTDWESVEFSVPQYDNDVVSIVAEKPRTGYYIYVVTTESEKKIIVSGYQNIEPPILATGSKKDLEHTAIARRYVTRFPYLN